MSACCVRSSGRLWPVVVVGLLGFLVSCCVRDVHAQVPGTVATVCPIRDVHSRNLLIHTDLSCSESDDLVERLETMLGKISTYWRQPMRGAIECYVIRNLNEFPVAATVPAGVRGVKTAGGVTLMQFNKEGKRQIAKSVVYASARFEVVQHEVVHAYCHQTFGRIGPVWYSEGMAEVGRFWTEGDAAVRAETREIEFLRNNPPKSLAETLSPTQVTGDGWQNYASRWALCHFLVHNPNYSHQFRQLGNGLLAGKAISFEQTYAATTRQLFFEYLFFLDHLSRGYRVDLCAWDWKKRFASLQPGQIQTVTVAAGRGWQPASLTVSSGTQYEHLATGAWQIAGEPKAVDANGDARGRGRLVGALMKDHRLGAEFELGAKGSLPLECDGDLYLRCRNAWNELAGDSGHVTVKFQISGQGPSLRDAAGDDRAACRTTCPSASSSRQ